MGDFFAKFWFGDVLIWGEAALVARVEAIATRAYGDGEVRIGDISMTSSCFGGKVTAGNGGRGGIVGEDTLVVSLRTTVGPRSLHCGSGRVGRRQLV